MAIDLASLIKVAPFAQEDKQRLLANLDKLTEEQQVRLSNAAWSSLAQAYYLKLKYEFDKLNLEIQEGKREFNKKDYDELKERVLQEYLKKLKFADSQESMKKLREELQKQMQKTSMTS